MGAKAQTIGYRYFFSLHMGLARGPLNEIVAINVGGLRAWDGPICGDDDLIEINKPDLFGGDKKEGGVKGPCKVLWGAVTQTLPAAATTAVGKLPSIAASLGGLVPAFRGVTTLWFHGMIAAMNPYPKEWAVRVRRYNNGWFNDTPWYPDKAAIYLQDESGNLIKAMNGAHIIYECITNPEWGAGDDASTIDEDSFVYCANKMCDEGLGLCLKWTRQGDEVGEFIQTVIDHIGGSLYTDRGTGLQTLRLIRDDYDAEDLPLFTPGTGLLSIVEDDSSSQDDAVSEVIVNYHDPVSNEDRSVRAQSTAAFQTNGSANSTTSQLVGYPTKGLAARAALRELKVATAGLKRMKVTLDRRGWRIAPASVFRVADPSRGIAEMILRAGDIDDGSFTSGVITISAIEDVFGFPQTAFVTPLEPGWTPPPTEALPPLQTRLIESGYRDIYLRKGEADTNALAPEDGFVGEMAVAPNTTTLEFDLLTKAAGDPEYVNQKTGPFTGAAIIPLLTTSLQTEIVLSNVTHFPEDLIGDAAMIDNEVIRIDDWDEDTLTMTIARGVADTVPAEHAVNARLWLTDDDMVTDERVYLEGETVFAKALSRTSSDVMTEAEADEDSVDIIGRQGRPYPVADLQVDGESIYTIVGEHAEPEITWVERNRITQADQLVGHTEAGIASEAGTTFNIRIYDAADDSLLRTEPGVATPWTYDSTMQAADGDPLRIYLEIEAERDGIVSWQNYHLPIILLSGYGYGYGLNYGGAG